MRCLKLLPEANGACCKDGLRLLPEAGSCRILRPPARMQLSLILLSVLHRSGKLIS